MSNSPFFQEMKNFLVFFHFWHPNPPKRYVIRLMFQAPLIFSVIFHYLNIKHMLLDESIQELAQYSGILLLLTTTAVKIFLSQTQKFQSLFKKAITDEETINANPEDDIRKSHIEYTNSALPLVRIFIYSCYGTLVFYTLCNCVFIITDLRYPDRCSVNSSICSRPLIINVFVPFNVNNNYIKTILFHQLFAYCGFQIIGGDLFVLTPIIYMTCKLKVLQHATRKFALHARQNTSSREEYNQETFNIIRNCIIEHQQILRYFVEIKDMLRNLMFVDFLCHSLQIASCIVVTILPETTMLYRAYMFSCSMATFMQLYLVYSHGHELTAQAENLSMAIYDSEWYEVDVRTRKCLVMMMMRCQKPIRLLVGPFYYVNLDLFLKMTKGIYTYTMMFLSNI